MTTGDTVPRLIMQGAMNRPRESRELPTAVAPQCANCQRWWLKARWQASWTITTATRRTTRRAVTEGPRETSAPDVYQRGHDRPAYFSLSDKRIPTKTISTQAPASFA